jgi:hypothetical protein
MKSNYFLSFISLLSYASIICMDKAPQIKDYDPSVVISAIEASFQGSLVISDSEVLFEHYHTKNTIKLSGNQVHFLGRQLRELCKSSRPVTIDEKLSLRSVLKSHEPKKYNPEDLYKLFSEEEILKLQVQRMRYFFQELPNIKSEAALTREVSKFKREYKEKFKSLFGNRCSSKTVAKDLIEWNAIIHDHVDFKQQDYAEKIHEYMWKLQKFPVKSPLKHCQDP